MSNTSTVTFSEAVEAIQINVENKDHTPTLLLGPPGCGKTAAAVHVAVKLGIPEDVAKRCIFRPSLRDPVDLMGLPYDEIEDGQHFTKWSSNSFIHYVNWVAETYGVAILIIDELPQAVPMMQNALAGLLLDRFVGENFLDERVFQVGTGNRVQDKAGAGRILSQLGNRVEKLDMATDLDGWCAHMIAMGYDPMMVAYIRFDPAALEDNDPDRVVNGTMRSWEAAAKLDPNTMSQSMYYRKMAGRVPEGRVAQYRSFRALFDELPTADEMCNTPMTAKLPSGNRGAMFAAACLAFKRATEDTFANLTQYVGRMATEAGAVDIETMFYKDILIHKEALSETREFGEWINGRGKSVML